jgi:exodeoxyribonuclease VII large subunit
LVFRFDKHQIVSVRAIVIATKIDRMQFDFDRDPPPNNPSTAIAGDICTVSALVQQTRAALERAIPLQWVSGEISGFKRAASGHCYFDLKDANAQVACVLYRNRAALVGFELRDGAQVELRLRPSIYEPRGSLQFTVEQARLAGVGRLYEAFLRLKAKLDAEGLFDPATKRELPTLPKTIGLITSPKAAALADMLRVLRDRWPRATVILYPASVQGANAPGELRAALNAANRRAECDVLILGRGGGSIEDLWAFNDEDLVRAVAASTIPIVSAVGHETDFTLCDFAADVRAPTPTAAAAMVAPERRALIAQIERLQEHMQRAVHRRIDTLTQRLDRAHERLRTSDRALAPWRERVLRAQSRLERALHVMPIARRGALTHLQERYTRTLVQRSAYAHTRERLRDLATRSQRAIDAQLTSEQNRLARLSQAIEHLNPHNVLERGYAMVLDANGQPITDARRVKTGETIAAQLKHGIIEANVTGTTTD